MDNVKSQRIIRDGGTNIVDISSNTVEFIAITLHIRKLSERKLIKLRFKMKNMSSFIVVKNFFDAVPSISSSIFRLNNGLKKNDTKSTINPCVNNIIKLLTLEVPWFRCFGRIIGNNMIKQKMGTTMELKESRPSV